MDTYEQENLFYLLDHTSRASSSSKDSFGCCSRYAACSDARSCLIPDRDYSRNCNYRKSLEQGHIFYGKNADNFHADIYQSLVDNYNALSLDATELLRGILYYAFITKRCIRLIMLADSPEIPTLERAGYLTQVERPHIIVRKYTMSAMLDACGSLIETANEWAKSRVALDKWKKRKSVRRDLPGIKITRDELSEWVLRCSPEAMKKLSEGISFVQLDLNKTLELEEFFKDCIYEEDISFPLDTLENDPRFLSQ